MRRQGIGRREHGPHGGRYQQCDLRRRRRADQDLADHARKNSSRPQRKEQVMIKFDYHEPTTLKKVFSLMERHGEDARVIAGGTSLIIMMRQRLLIPKIVLLL